MRLSERVLPAVFYTRSPENVARDLLGKTLIRILHGDVLGGIVAETEAYHGLDDPASRAFRGKKSYNSPMWDEPSHLFVYNVHKYWMLNVVAHEPGEVGGVLFRAIEPTMGIRIMRRLRPVADDRELTSGPGKLSLALGVTRELNGCPTTDLDSPVHVLDAHSVTEVLTSHRIGVIRDLPQELRFYISGNRFVSRGLPRTRHNC